MRVEQEYTLQTAHGPKRLIELFTTSILGVTRLAAPGLMVLLEATAVDRAEQG